MSKTKAKFLAIVRLATELGETLDWDELSVQLGVTPEQLQIWVKEINQQDVVNSVLDLTALAKPLREAAATQIVEDALEIETTPQLHLNENGTIEVIKEAVVISETERKKRLLLFRDSVEGLTLLKQEVQGTAGIIVDKIADLLEDDKVSSQDLSRLTTALTSIQQAFFNKPITNIQVNNIAGEGRTLLSSFRGNQQA